MATPTQVRRPWRATVRSIFQFAIALATLLPFIAADVYDNLDQAPYSVVQVLAVAATVTRVMALPQVEDFLQRHFPWLAAQPITGEHRADTTYAAPAPDFAAEIAAQRQAIEEARDLILDVRSNLAKDTGRAVADQLNQAARRPRRIDPPPSTK